MPERVRTEIAPKVEVDPLEVVRRIVGNEHDRDPRSQPCSELPERIVRAINAVECLDSTVLKGVDVNGAKLRHVADCGRADAERRFAVNDDWSVHESPDILGRVQN